MQCIKNVKMYIDLKKLEVYCTVFCFKFNQLSAENEIGYAHKKFYMKWNARNNICAVQLFFIVDNDESMKITHTQKQPTRQQQSHDDYDIFSC